MMIDIRFVEFIILSFCAYTIIVRKVDAQAENTLNRLYSALGLNDGGSYNPALPPYNGTEPVKVKVWFRLQQIYGVQEESALHTNVELIQTWYDNNLKWNPEDYNDLADLVVNWKSVWTPDIIVQNSVLDSSLRYTQFFGEESEQVRLEYTGFVTRKPSYLLNTECQFDFTYFQYDAHKCSFNIGSVMHDRSALRLETQPFPTSQDLEVSTTHINKRHATSSNTDIISTSEWMFSFLTSRQVISRGADGRLYDTALVEVVFSRDSTIYKEYIVTPFLYLLCITLLSLFLPPEHDERISILMAVLLTYTVLCLVVTESVPKYSRKTPQLTHYLTHAMFYNVCLMAWCCIFIGLYNIEKSPFWYYTILSSHFDKRRKSKVISETPEQNKEENEARKRQEEQKSQSQEFNDKVKMRKFMLEALNLFAIVFFLVFNVDLIRTVWTDLPSKQDEQIASWKLSINMSEIIDYTDIYG